MSSNDEVATPQGPPVLSNGLCYPYRRGEDSLKATLKTIYPNDCEVDLRRWLSDFSPSSCNQHTQPQPVDCPVAAAVYTKTTRLVLAIAVYYPEVSVEELQSARELCSRFEIRFYPIERLEAYPADILERSVLCEEAGLGPEYSAHIIPAARCPKCRGPLVHKIRAPTYARNGLFYACAQFIGNPVSCSGFLCSADEIFEYSSVGFRESKYRLQSKQASESGESDWA